MFDEHALVARSAEESVDRRLFLPSQTDLDISDRHLAADPAKVASVSRCALIDCLAC
jgi:hypothetical protein